MCWDVETMGEGIFYSHVPESFPKKHDILHTGFFKQKQPTDLKSGEESLTPLVPRFQCCVTAVLGGAFKQNSHSCSGHWEAMFSNIETGGPGLPVDVETFWSMAFFFGTRYCNSQHIYIYIYLFIYLFINLFIYMCTLWLFNIAMENCPFIDDFPIKTSIYKGFSMVMLNDQMVYISIYVPWISWRNFSMICPWGFPAGTASLGSSDGDTPQQPGVSHPAGTLVALGTTKMSGMWASTKRFLLKNHQDFFAVNTNSSVSNSSVWRSMIHDDS